MIETDLLDRVEYNIGGDWCVHEILSVPCPKCGAETVEVITYPDMTLYYHNQGSGPKMRVCTVGKGTYRIPKRLEPWFKAQPMNF